MVGTAKDDQQLFLEIRKFIAEQTGIKQERVNLNSRLEQDLRISGDDLIELIDAIFKQFEIAIGDFDYAQYVGAEGLSLFGGLADRLLGRPVQSSKPLLVSMFVSAAKARLWVSPN
jgi:acyl carrier protein